MQINERKPKGQSKWTSKRNWQHSVHKTKKKSKPTAQYVLDTTIGKHKQRKQDMSPQVAVQQIKETKGENRTRQSKDR